MQHLAKVTPFAVKASQGPLKKPWQNRVLVECRQIISHTNTKQQTGLLDGQPQHFSLPSLFKKCNDSLLYGSYRKNLRRGLTLGVKRSKADTFWSCIVSSTALTFPRIERYAAHRIEQEHLCANTTCTKRVRKCQPAQGWLLFRGVSRV